MASRALTRMSVGIASIAGIAGTSGACSLRCSDALSRSELSGPRDVGIRDSDAASTLVHSVQKRVAASSAPQKLVARHSSSPSNQ